MDAENVTIAEILHEVLLELAVNVADTDNDMVDWIAWVNDMEMIEDGANMIAVMDTLLLITLSLPYQSQERA